MILRGTRINILCLSCNRHECLYFDTSMKELPFDLWLPNGGTYYYLTALRYIYALGREEPFIMLYNSQMESV